MTASSETTTACHVDDDPARASLPAKTLPAPGIPLKSHIVLVLPSET